MNYTDSLAHCHKFITIEFLRKILLNNDAIFNAILGLVSEIHICVLKSAFLVLFPRSDSGVKVMLASFCELDFSPSFSSM